MLINILLDIVLALYIYMHLNFQVRWLLQMKQPFKTASRRMTSYSYFDCGCAEITICEDEVQDLLSNLDTSKACGPDDIPVCFLKEGAPWLASPLTRLFNLSLSQSHLPRYWTSANVTPIFKNGSKHSVANYRPISLTCIAVKTLERLLHNHLTNSLGDKLTHHQYGIHSGQTLLLETVHVGAVSG